MDKPDTLQQSRPGEQDALLIVLGRISYALDQHCIVSIADTSGAIIYANDKLSEISGYPREELLGRNHRILNSGYHPREFFEEMWHAITSGKVWHGIIRNRRKDGGHYWVDSTIVPFLDADGLPYQYVSIRTDFTDLKRVEEELLEAKRRAEEASRAKSEFLSRMSHELRTPMNAILGFAQLLENDPDEPLTPMQRENMQHILKAGWHLLDLINEVLDISRIEAGRMQLELLDFDLGGLLQECVGLVLPLANSRHIRIIEDITGCGGYSVHADLIRLKEVLINLLSNAIKYNHDHGTITIECRQSAPDRLRLLVTDSGVGIPPEKQHLLFEPFSRLGAEKSGIIGAGIGLAIAKRMMELMGGAIGVESRAGEGSTFWIELAAGKPAHD